MNRKCPSCRLLGYLGIWALLVLAPPLAAYKARSWTLRSPDSYPARLASEGVTIAAEALFRDDMAASVFDKNDIVTRGIMPLAIVIFNDNDFPITVIGGTIELICEEDHLRSLDPAQVVRRLFEKGGKGTWIPQPLPRMPGSDRPNREAMEDFVGKLLGEKTVPPHQKAGGFLYLHLPEPRDTAKYLARSRVYIPEVYRQDSGQKLIFFEFDLKPAIEAAATK